jgi:hypothetical protein
VLIAVGKFSNVSEMDKRFLMNRFSEKWDRDDELMVVQDDQISQTWPELSQFFIDWPSQKGRGNAI